MATGSYLKMSPGNVCLDVLEAVHVLHLDQFVPIHSSGFMQPELHKLNGCLYALRSGEQDALHVWGSKLNGSLISLSLLFW